MSAWSFEVKDGRLATLPVALVAVIEEDRRLNAEFCLVAEAGALLNEPDERLMECILKRDSPTEVIARLGHVCAWLFDHLEIEFGQHFRWNYLKLSFVNLKPLQSDDGSRSGRMTTNHPDLPTPSEQPAAPMMHQMATTLTFFSHLRGSVEISGWEADLYRCDWATMSFTRAP